MKYCCEGFKYAVNNDFIDDDLPFQIVNIPYNREKFLEWKTIFFCPFCGKKLREE